MADLAHFETHYDVFCNMYLGSVLMPSESHILHLLFTAGLCYPHFKLSNATFHHLTTMYVF